MFEHKKALLLDMNSTFMFGEDRFGDEYNYYPYYSSIGGKLSQQQLTEIMTTVFEYLNHRYPLIEYRHCFPSVSDAIDISFAGTITASEKDKIIQTFSFHEHGEIPQAYREALIRLHEKYQLSVVIDIWSPKDRWVETFKNLGIWALFSACSFSSDHGMVKPSPKPFEQVAEALGICREKCLMIGDSTRRDLGGALAAGIDCVLVGGARHEKALACFDSLLEFQQVVQPCHL